MKCASQDDEVAIIQRNQSKQAYLKRLLTIFRELDSSDDGHLTQAELDRVMTDPFMKTWMASINIEGWELQRLFELLDDGDGLVSQDEFVDGICKMKGEAKSIDVVSTLKQVQRLHAKCDLLITDVQQLQRAH